MKMSGPTGKTRAEVVAEQDWLRRRVRNIGSWSSDDAPLGGTAANAMVEHALGGLPPTIVPASADELQACMNTLASAPEHLRRLIEEDIAHYERESGLEAAATPPGRRNISLADFAAQLLGAADNDPESAVVVYGQSDGVGVHSYDPKQEGLIGDRSAASLPAMEREYAADELVAEWQWLRERAKLTGILFSEQGAPVRSWGRSSNALVEHLLGGPRPQEFPLDGSDLAACEEAVKDAPAHLKEKAEPVLVDYRASVAAYEQSRLPARPQLVDGAGPAAATPEPEVSDEGHEL